MPSAEPPRHYSIRFALTAALVVSAIDIAVVLSFSAPGERLIGLSYIGKLIRALLAAS